MTDTKAADDAAVIDGLLQALRRARSESDVEHRLRSLLEACDTGRWQPQVTVAGARPDLVNYQYRVVVETKARELADPAQAGSRPGSSQRDQLEGYVRDLNGQLPYGTIRPWRGFLTDGDVWWGWEWSDSS